MMMGGPGITEILVIALILVLIFGAKRLPKIGEGLGKTVKELKKIKKDASGEKGSKDTKKVATEGEDQTDTPKSGNGESEDVTDVIQKKVTQKVTDTVMAQVPGVKQAKQLKDKAEKLKKFVS